MRFAFLVHPLTEDTKRLLELDPSGELRLAWGQDLLSFCGIFHDAIQGMERRAAAITYDQVRVIDELPALTSALGAHAEGRLYEVPMPAAAILDDPTRAMAFMEQAVDQATEWGAEVVGLGSLTGIIGGQGSYLAERSSIAVTTGNSLTVFAALQSLFHACRETSLELENETVVVVGAPGSIATAAATLLAPRCGKLVLVARRRAPRAVKLAEQLGAELLLDIPQAVGQARVIFSATSSGDCIDQAWLQPGSVVVDVGVPTDVRGTGPTRDDVLVLTGGLAKIPESMSDESNYIWFHHGMIPSCLAETMVLALEKRPECYSLGRELSVERIQQVGSLACGHGFDFGRLFSFGVPLDDSSLVRFRKAQARSRAVAVNGKPPSLSSEPPSAEQLASRAGQLYSRHINPVLMAMGSPSGFVKTFVRGSGTSLWDAGGTEYTDFVSGFGSVNLGHNHPAVAEAIQSAVVSQAPGFAQASVNPYAAALAEQLVELSPGPLEMVFFANSGTESVEAAIKLARASTGRGGMVCCERSYHGKTLGSLSITGNTNYQRPFGPLVPEVAQVPFGDLEALERTLATRQFAALVVEPIQAEGGMNLPPEGYLREAQRICRQNGTLLVVDEVQTGMGRTGSLFAVDALGVEPDIMTLAKSLGGGMVPIGAMLARRDLWMKAYGTVQTFALHTSTFGGGSLACAAGLATLQVLREENLAANAAQRGRQLHEGLAKLCDKHVALHEARGQGLLFGLEFTPQIDSLIAHWNEVDGGRMSRFLVPDLDPMLRQLPAMYAMKTLMDEFHIYSQVTRSNPLVLRCQPPLTVSAKQIDYFLKALDRVGVEIHLSNQVFDGMIAKSGTGQHNAKEDAPAESPASSALTGKQR